MNVSNLQVIISIILAIIPVIIWLRILFKSEEKQKTAIFWIFTGGALSVVAILALQLLWKRFPVLDIYSLIERSIENVNLSHLGVFVAVGVIEEIGKHYAVKYADKKVINIETVKDSINLSLVAALGFAFAENIYYFYNIWTYYGLSQLFFPFVFRSVFTTAGHMIFSGIFGYFYGIAKFAKPITEQKVYIGKISKVREAVEKSPYLKYEQLFRKKTIFYGLLAAMVIHAVFNFMLQLNMVLYVVVYIIFFFALVMYLTRRKAAKLMYNVNFQRPSTLGKEDEEVILEFIGMHYKAKNYNKVIEISERFLKRSPDNNTAKIFLSKAYDKLKIRKVLDALKLFTKKAEFEAKPEEKKDVEKDVKGVVEEFIEQSYVNENYKDCVEICKNILKREPENEFAKQYLTKSFSKLKKQKFGEAVTDLFEKEEEEKVEREEIYKEK